MRIFFEGILRFFNVVYRKIESHSITSVWRPVQNIFFVSYNIHNSEIDRNWYLVIVGWGGQLFNNWWGEYTVALFIGTTVHHYIHPSCSFGTMTVIRRGLSLWQLDWTVIYFSQFGIVVPFPVQSNYWCSVTMISSSNLSISMPSIFSRIIRRGMWYFGPCIMCPK